MTAARNYLTATQLLLKSNKQTKNRHCRPGKGIGNACYFSDTNTIERHGCEQGLTDAYE